LDESGSGKDRSADRLVEQNSPRVWRRVASALNLLAMHPVTRMVGSSLWLLENRACVSAY